MNLNLNVKRTTLLIAIHIWESQMAVFVIWRCRIIEAEVFSARRRSFLPDLPTAEKPVLSSDKPVPSADKPDLDDKSPDDGLDGEEVK